MSHPSSNEIRWAELADRHLEMYYALFDRGFFDGAMFHAYHAFECAISALLASYSIPIPPDGRRESPLGSFYKGPHTKVPAIWGAHRAKLALVSQIDTSHMNCSILLSQLLPQIRPHRNASLYYDKVSGWPQVHYSSQDLALELGEQVDQFIRALRSDILNPPRIP